jgi:glycerol-3-phosphate acyltransferase PlsY
MIKDLIIIIIAYLLGSLNAAILYSKIVKHDDIRNYGSGNAGATNTLRTYGLKVAFCVIVFDVLKGVIAVIIAKRFSGTDLAIYAGAFAAVIGHNYPIFEGFKGGKGIAVSGGVSLAIDWRLGLIWIITGLTIAYLTKYVSLGSVLAAITFGVGFLVFHYGNWIVVGCGLFTGALATFMHRQNIVRLLKGQERKTNLFKK